MNETEQRTLYCFLDEAGDFNFSPSGSKCFLYTALVSDCPTLDSQALLEAQYSIIENGGLFSKSHMGNDCFHAAEDSLETRQTFFSAICGIEEVRAYSVIIRKNRANPSIREPQRFYSLILKRLLAEIISQERVLEKYGKVCIITDNIPVQKKKSAVVKNIKSSLNEELLRFGIPYVTRQMASKSVLLLQASDYISWALYRKWCENDIERYTQVSRLVRKEVDYFYYGEKTYY